ncbi:hypothetical protein PS903_01023 [Pseudomonas fluorescens]|nr:hypothetical protein PS903_01023 [Pseudomonas fluorescens]
MDIDSFGQCLSYIAATNKKSTMETIFPMLTTLLGVIVGFGINYLRDTNKARKEASNKRKCIDEDIQRILRSSEQAFKECLRILDSALKNQPFRGYRLPADIDSPCLDEYFASIAHKYSQEERHHIFLLIPYLNSLNECLQKVKDIRDPSNFDETIILSRNAVGMAHHCAGICKAIMAKGIEPEDFNIVTFTDELGVKFDCIEEARASMKSEPQV